jgi:hypothetical protein
VAAYAARAGLTDAEFLAERDPVLTAGQVGGAVTDLAAGKAEHGAAYLLTAAGLRPLG